MTPRIQERAVDFLYGFLRSVAPVVFPYQKDKQEHILRTASIAGILLASTPMSDAIGQQVGVAQRGDPIQWCGENQMMKKVLSTGTLTAALLAASAAYAAPPVSQLDIPWQGIIDMGSSFDVYYKVVADPNNTLCSNGPLECEFNGSPIIAKKDGEGTTTGDAYTGQTFSGANIDDVETPSSPGTWSYTLGATPDQHYVTAWVTKDGSPDLLTVFWLVADGTTLAGDTSYTGIAATPGVNYPWWAVNTCTDGKTAQPDGNDMCKEGGLSNIVWFNSGGNNPPEEIPEPGLLGLLGLALAGLGFAARRRRV